MNLLEQQFLRSPEPEVTFYQHLENAIATASTINQSRMTAYSAAKYRPFKPLLLGYTGAGNIGADVRVAEIIRQFKTIFSHVGFDPGLVVLGFGSNEPALNSLRKVPMNSYFPNFLKREVDRHDAVIACEGSMFTSTFSDALTAIFAAGIGYAVQSGKLGVGYGADAGKMSERLSKFVEKVCQDGLILCRNANSQVILSQLGLNVSGGADPAWTFEPANCDARQILIKAGWNSRDPILAVCPVNPFWWPVVIDFAKAQALKSEGKYRDLHYRSVFFHSWSEESQQKYKSYLNALAFVVNNLQKQGYYPILVGMERLDAASCDRLNELLNKKVPKFVSGQYGMDAMTAILRTAAISITSRFHGAVLAMSGLVPTIGVSLDSRIAYLFEENGLEKWFLECDSPDLGEKIIALVEDLETERAEIAKAYSFLVASQVKAFGQMGIELVDEIIKRDPDFPPPSLPRKWDAYLPPLSKRIENLIQDYTVA